MARPDQPSSESRVLHCWDRPAFNIQTPLYKSLDAGLTWHGIRNGLWSETNSLAVGGSSERVWHAATRVGVFTSVDEGESWRPASDGLAAGYDVCDVNTDPAHPDTAYAAVLYILMSDKGRLTLVKLRTP